MASLAYRRLTPEEPLHVAEFQRVFRGTPSFVYATAGRPATDAEVEAMMRTLPAGRGPEDIFIHAISTQGEVCGCSFVVDSKNERALKFWLREGFVEQCRRNAPGFLGEAIAIFKNGL